MHEKYIARHNVCWWMRSIMTHDWSFSHIFERFFRDCLHWMLIKPLLKLNIISWSFYVKSEPICPKMYFQYLLKIEKTKFNINNVVLPFRYHLFWKKTWSLFGFNLNFLYLTMAQICPVAPEKAFFFKCCQCILLFRYYHL